MTGAWTREHLAAPGPGAECRAPVIRASDLAPVVEGHDVWDAGPVRTPEGGVATAGGEEPWLVLSAPATGDPGERHHRARLRLVGRRPGGWRDGGDLFPEGASLGSREWAATGVLDAGRGVLDVLYTAAGGRAPSDPHFSQRIAAASARVDTSDSGLRIGAWGPHAELLRADGDVYAPTDAHDGEPGFIKAFRDPFPLRDPAGGREWLLFTGSAAGSASPFNGCVGLAERRPDGGYALRDPLLTADGVNNELERPHVVVRAGRYHLFFSTQRRTFAPGVSGPNGLYGFVAPALAGPYEPINGTGLVVANPDEEPYQAYSWLVLPDLSVASFVDAHSLGGRSPESVAAAGPREARRHFGGTLAPMLRIALDGATARIVA